MELGLGMCSQVRPLNISFVNQALARLVLGSGQWTSQDTSSRRRVEGDTLHFADGQDLSPSVDVVTSDLLDLWGGLSFPLRWFSKPAKVNAQELLEADRETIEWSRWCG